MAMKGNVVHFLRVEEGGGVSAGEVDCIWLVWFLPDHYAKGLSKLRDGKSEILCFGFW